uniref:MFS transporter n=1 Tax=Thermosporothrix sp. COM3 TaxID=2490863 RepID=A0A455SJI3_9CHLR|nr:MFS transporter [Thermosporothrix sp. COM3]
MPFFFILVLALGTFAIGTDEYLVAGLLPTVAAEMKVSQGVVGQLVTVFALTYALSSPLLAAVTVHLPRKRVLLGAMVLFSLANLLAFFAPSAMWLFLTRFLAALAAALYTPTAMATVAQLVEGKLRARAMSLVLAGTTSALVLGLPLGSWIGTLFGWRMSFGLVALLGAIVTVFLGILCPHIPPVENMVTWRERFQLLGKKQVLQALGITFFGLVAGHMLLTYVMPFLKRLTTFDAATLSIVLFGSGIASVMGNLIGGHLTDRLGIRQVLIGVYSFLILNTLSFALLMLFPKSVGVNILVVALFFLWGLASWLGAPALNSYLVSIEPQAATVVLSLNSMVMFLGIAGAGSVGGLVLSTAGVEYLAIVSSILEALVLILVLRSGQRLRLAAS